MQPKRIVHVRTIGNIPTMDIEVNSDSHIFYGDGIVTSNSHAISYAINAYWSAYCKTYKRKKFYEKYLNRSDRKPDPDIEKKQLIMDAKRCEIEVLPPRLQHLHKDFTRHPSKDIIYYGLSHVKHVAEKECDKLIGLSGVEKYNWMDCLINIVHGLNINKSATVALISVGAFNGINNTTSRQKMLYEFDSWKHLTAKEQEAIANAYNSGSQKPKDLTQAIEWLITNTKINSRRLQSVEDIKNSLKNPFYDIDDKPETIAADEEKYMSCSLTCSKVDGLDLNTVINMCQDVSSHSIIGKVTLAVEIVRIKIVKTKKGKTPGQEMAFLTVEDGSGSLDSITIFPEAYDKYKDLLVENNTVLLIGEIFKKDKEAIIVNQVSQI